MPGTNDVSDTLPPYSQSARRETPFRTAIWKSWSILLGSRERVLLQNYADAIQAVRPDAVPPEDLTEARSTWDAVDEHPPFSEFDREVAETRWVRSVRLIALWIVFWSTILPLVLITAFCVRHAVQGPVWPRLLIDCIIGIVAFPLLSVFGLIFQAFLIRPFVAFANWLVQ